jgi:hypothetical protein
MVTNDRHDVVKKLIEQEINSVLMTPTGVISTHLGKLEETLAKKRREIVHMNQESRGCDNIDNLYPVPYSEPDTNSHSIRIVSSTKE